MRTAGRGSDWIVLLEVADGGDGATIDLRALRRLAEACGPPAPTTLCSPGRYAIQMAVRAADAPAALSVAAGRWQRALRHCGLPDWQLVRAEVLTPAELEAELRHAEADPSGAPPPAPPPAPPLVVDPVEEELLRRALFDSVTGLPSRALFLEELRAALERGPGAPSVHAVIVVHMDVPDAVDPADDVFAQVAHRLTGVVRDCDTVGRVGTFDFGLLVEVRSAGHSGLVADRILAGVRWILRGARPGPPVVSVGVATSPAGGDADQLLEAAEAAVGPTCCDRHAEPAGGVHDDCP